MSVSAKRNCEIRPTISLLIVVSDTIRHLSVAGERVERVVVTSKTKLDNSNLKGECHICSEASPARRLNLAISLASGEWVVPITGDVEPSKNWLTELEQQLTANNEACALILQGVEDATLFVIRRRAFAYGALDERLSIAELALFDWAERIFPLPKYRELDCEGIKRLPVTGLRRLSRSNIAHHKQAHTSPLVHSSPVSTTSEYDPRLFWDKGTADYVKWEVFQPDEAEIKDALCLTNPRRLLELGCGAGRNIRYFASAEIYVGIDIANNLLRRAGDRTADNTWGLIHGDIVQLPFGDASFDLVFSDSTVQHIEPGRIEGCITDILRVSARYVCLIEFVDELTEHPGWFKNIHMFKHDYVKLMQGRARLLQRRATDLQIQPAIKEYFLFEKI